MYIGHIYIQYILENPQNIIMIPTMLITMLTAENVNFSFAFKLMGKKCQRQLPASAHC